ncbi:NAD(P)H-binding protein [Streptococcus sp. NLN76]|uniref:NAD(P)H-binding protein n=1 Tax=Streptococcus sp. NLN76 TaxID=2822800 RepID=UPI0018AAA336|nr:NAD(P)H-binding protein [Streptococcus sp. NLN76]MBF8970015.1 NAD(P)H-binding protein [Streptococcus sp. NLN76]
MKVTILGAAGQIAKLATRYFLEQTEVELVLFARNAQARLQEFVSPRVTLVDGDFADTAQVSLALAGADVAFLAFVGDDQLVGHLLPLVEKAGVSRFIVSSVPDIYQEIEGPFQDWYRSNTGIMWTSHVRKAADVVEASDLDYLILRITWLYNAEGKKLHVTRKGEPFTEAQVTRQLVAQFVVDAVSGKEDFHRESVGLGEVGTKWEKPSFY